MKPILIGILIVLVVLSGCLDSISAVKSDDYVGKRVAVRGTVENTIKIGAVSGYVLVGDDGEKINVASDVLPREGTKKTVKGILQKKLITGYYIEEE